MPSNLTPFIAQVSEWLGVTAVAMLAGISPRFARKLLAFQYPRREVTVSLALFAACAAAAVIIYSFFPPARVELFPTARLMAGAACLFLTGMALRVRGQPVRSAGWGQQTLRPALLLGLALAVLALFLRGRIFTMARQIGQAEAVSLLIWLGICAAEETLFRGYLQLRLSAAWGVWKGTAAAAVLYALFQIPLRLYMGLEMQGVLLAVGLALLQGLVLGYLMQKSGNVLAGIIYRTISEWALAVF